MNFQSGAFGDPTQLRTLILFWTKMELLHYPGAGETKTYLEDELKQQQTAAQMQQAAQLLAAGNAAAIASDGGPERQHQETGIDPAMAQAVVQQARADAARDMGSPQDQGQTLGSSIPV